MEAMVQKPKVGLFHLISSFVTAYLVGVLRTDAWDFQDLLLRKSARLIPPPPRRTVPPRKSRMRTRKRKRKPTTLPPRRSRKTKRATRRPPRRAALQLLPKPPRAPSCPRKTILQRSKGTRTRKLAVLRQTLE